MISPTFRSSAGRWWHAELRPILILALVVFSIRSSLADKAVPGARIFQSAATHKLALALGIHCAPLECRTFLPTRFSGL
jgi:hypothetical protein